MNKELSGTSTQRTARDSLFGDFANFGTAIAYAYHGARAIVLHSSCTGWMPRPYCGLGRGHKTICRSWEVSMTPSSPRAGSTRARHDDSSDRPHHPPRPPLSQRSFLWPKRLAAGVAAAKGGPGEAVGPAGVVGALNTISNYATRPLYARLGTPHGGNRASSMG